MSFTSFKFLLFLVITVILYYIVPKKHQWKVLLAASYIFYFFCGKWYLPYIMLTTATSYFAAVAMKKNLEGEKNYIDAHRDRMSKDDRKAYKADEKKKRRIILISALILNFGILGVLKYTGFMISNINSVIHIFSPDTSLGIPSLILPLGISFYTFQTMGYLIDVYREKTCAEGNIFRFALFVSFFPQLLQGPISRHSTLSEQLYCGHSASWDNISSGALRIAYGYFKKLIIADTVMIAINTIIGGPDTYRGAYVFILIIAYSAQIYADFTGGIDVTLGIAEALGIRLAENFDHPFASVSTKEYWNRWHITMGSWFTDYIFYPLSISKPMQKLSKVSRAKLGNAIGKRVPVYTATIATWFLTGLWHGASWNFIVWGLMNCLIILISQELTPLYAKFHNKFPRLKDNHAYIFFCRTRTFLLMGTVRILDCYRDVPATFKNVGSMFTMPGTWKDMLTGGILKLGLDIKDILLILCAVAVVCIVSRYQRSEGVSLRHRISKSPAITCAVICALITVIAVFGAYGLGFDSSQFIYTQF